MPVWGKTARPQPGLLTTTFPASVVLRKMEDQGSQLIIALVGREEGKIELLLCAGLGTGGTNDVAAFALVGRERMTNPVREN